eukprot:9603458-Lingulodinium_polyedra.AAC.1
MSKKRRGAAATAAKVPQKDEMTAALAYVLDETSLQEREQFAIKMNTWCRATLDAIVDECFWVVMMIRHRIGKPLEHFRRILQGHDKL